MIAIANIIDAVCNRYGTDRARILAPSRYASNHEKAARLVIYWLARRLTPLSFPAIARATGCRSHISVLKGIQRFQRRIDARPAFRMEMERFCLNIGAASATKERSNEPDHPSL